MKETFGLSIYELEVLSSTADSLEDIRDEEIRNRDKTQKTGRDIWKESSAGKLMKKLNEIFGLNIYKLEILSSTPDNLEDIRDEGIRKLLNICMKEGNCEELKKLVSEYGEYSSVQYNQ